LAVGSWQLAVGSWQLAVGSWQLAVGSWQLAVDSESSSQQSLVELSLVELNCKNHQLFLKSPALICVHMPTFICGLPLNQ
jgi:hypothetical protein